MSPATALRLVRSNWSKNHRHQGGVAAAGRCLLGSWRVHRTPAAGVAPDGPELEVLTFSVVPWMTALWGRLLLAALPPETPVRLIIGDCSGGFGEEHRRWLGTSRVTVLPYLNAHHGDKLDTFVSRICRGRFTLVCDDDVFWLDGAPLRWALGELRGGAAAVATLEPRRRVSSVLDGRVEEPMGSSCLLVDRRLWLDQELSFRVAEAEAPERFDWFYDTGDRANLQLLERGFRIAVAPAQLRGHLRTPEAVSSWVLKLQKHPPPKLLAAADIPIKREKAWRGALVARDLGALLARRGGGELLPKMLLDDALEILAPKLLEHRRAEIVQEVEELVDTLRRRLDEIDTAESEPQTEADVPGPLAAEAS